MSLAIIAPISVVFDDDDFDDDDDDFDDDDDVNDNNDDDDDVDRTGQCLSQSLLQSLLYLP